MPGSSPGIVVPPICAACRVPIRLPERAEVVLPTGAIAFRRADLMRVDDSHRQSPKRHSWLRALPGPRPPGGGGQVTEFPRQPSLTIDRKPFLLPRRRDSRAMPADRSLAAYVSLRWPHPPSEIPISSERVFRLQLVPWKQVIRAAIACCPCWWGRAGRIHVAIPMRKHACTRRETAVWSPHLHLHPHPTCQIRSEGSMRTAPIMKIQDHVGDRA